MHGLVRPGEYEVRIASRSSMGENYYETFIIEMIDPCDPPESLNAPELEDIEYEIGSP